MVRRDAHSSGPRIPWYLTMCTACRETGRGELVDYPVGATFYREGDRKGADG